jgi:hypothetical protein
MKRLVRRCAVLAIATATIACARKAPGPLECHEIAVAWERYEAPVVADRLTGQLRAVLSESRITERTRLCLVTPFDREVLDCVRSGKDVTRCFLALERRLERAEARAW